MTSHLETTTLTGRDRWWPVGRRTPCHTSRGAQSMARTFRGTRSGRSTAQSQLRKSNPPPLSPPPSLSTVAPAVPLCSCACQPLLCVKEAAGNRFSAGHEAPDCSRLVTLFVCVFFVMACSDVDVASHTMQCRRLGLQYTPQFWPQSFLTDNCTAVTGVPEAMPNRFGGQFFDGRCGAQLCTHPHAALHTALLRVVLERTHVTAVVFGTKRWPNAGWRWLCSAPSPVATWRCRRRCGPIRPLASCCVSTCRRRPLGGTPKRGTFCSKSSWRLPTRSSVRSWHCRSGASPVVVCPCCCCTCFEASDFH